MRTIKRSFWILVLVLVAVFAVINVETVEIVIDPLGLGFEALRPVYAPLAVVIFATLGIGLLVGVVLENDRGRAARRDLRRAKADLARLEADVERMHRAMKAADHPDSAGPPARLG